MKESSSHSLRKRLRAIGKEPARTRPRSSPAGLSSRNVAEGNYDSEGLFVSRTRNHPPEEHGSDEEVSHTGTFVNTPTEDLLEEYSWAGPTEGNDNEREFLYEDRIK